MKLLTYHLLAWISFITAIYAWIIDPLINKESNNDTIMKYLPFLFIVMSTFFLCLDAGSTIPMSMYYSCIVFVNSIDIESKRILFYLIDVLSKVILITTLFEGIRNSIERAYYYLFFDDKTYIIHSDNELGDLLYKNIDKPFKAILCKSDSETYYERFKNHILLYEEDDDNVRLCTELSKEDKDIYIFTKNIDMSYFVKDNIHPLNLNQIVATKFWVEAAKKINDKLIANKYKLTIGIVGEEELTVSIFKAALQYNIYSTKQEIEYCCISSEDTIEMLKKQANLIENKMLDDSYSFYNWIDYDRKKADKKEIKDFDLLVVCDNNYYSKEIANTAKTDTIYVFNKYYSNKDDLNEVNNNSKGREILFGSYNKLLTINNILNEDLVTGGKVINLFYNYIEKLEGLEALSEKERIKEMNSLWLKANSYNRNSSIVASQYNKIRQTINKEINDENLNELGELEHTRWCRFVYLDGWTYSKWNSKNFGDYEEKLYISKINKEDIEKMSDDEIVEGKFYIKDVTKKEKEFIEVSKKEKLYVSFRINKEQLLSVANKNIEIYVGSDEKKEDSIVVRYSKKISKNETNKLHIFLVPYNELPEFDTIKDRTISLNTNYIEDLKQQRK